MQHAAPSGDAKTCTVCKATFTQRVGPRYVRQESDASYRVRRCCSPACRAAFYRQHPFFAAMCRINPTDKSQRLKVVNKGRQCLYCDAPAKIRQMCHAHYGRWKERGDPRLVENRSFTLHLPGTILVPAKTCALCNTQVKDDTLCYKHRREQRIRDGELHFQGTPAPDMRGRRAVMPTTCSICDRPHRRRGMCQRHYQEYLLHQRVLKAASKDA